MGETPKKRVALVATHPVQYHIPWFIHLSKRQDINLSVYYALIPDENQQGVGFGIPFKWDIDMMNGYVWEVLPNSATSPSLHGFLGSSTPAIYSILKKQRPDVVIITGWQSLPLLQALWACIRLRLPRIIRGESNAMRVRPWWVRFIHRLLLSQYSAFLAIGKANREFYLSYGIHEERIFTCSYFVDNRSFQERFSKIQDDRDILRAGWGIQKDDVCFLYAGKLISKKRILDLLEALGKACLEMKNLRLLVVGTGELMASAKQYVAQHHLPATFAGFLNQTEIVKAYVAADCLVLPSDFGETWGLVVNEAMACGRPAIVSERVGCGPDLIEDGVTGYIYPCGDINALSNRLISLALYSEIRLQMGQNAREKIKEYSVEKAVEGTLHAIDYVLDMKS